MARFSKRILIAAGILLATTLINACQEGGDAGDLLGQWRLTDMKVQEHYTTYDNAYLSFSGSIALFRCPGENEVFAKFQRSADSLFIQCTSIYGAPADTALVERVFGLRPFTDIRLKVDALSSERLSFSQGNQQWRFRKY